jgi:hypothetical protein
MMYWAVGICCYAYKQYVATGAVADSMFVSVSEMVSRATIPLRQDRTRIVLSE